MYVLCIHKIFRVCRRVCMYAQKITTHEPWLNYQIDEPFKDPDSTEIYPQYSNQHSLNLNFSNLENHKYKISLTHHFCIKYFTLDLMECEEAFVFHEDDIIKNDDSGTSFVHTTMLPIKDLPFLSLFGVWTSAQVFFEVNQAKMISKRVYITFRSFLGLGKVLKVGFFQKNSLKMLFFTRKISDFLPIFTPKTGSKKVGP